MSTRRGNMEIEARVIQFAQMLSCKYPIYVWRLDENFTLIFGNCEDTQLWNRVFEHGIVKPTLSAQRSREGVIILGSSLGLLCGALVLPQEGCVYVLGPIMTNEASVNTVMAQLRYLSVANNMVKPDFAKFRAAMTQELQRVPSVLFGEFTGDVIMFYHFVTGQQISRKDIVYLQSANVSPAPVQKPKHDRGQIYSTSQALLQMVEEGNLAYEEIYDKASLISTGVRVQSKDPLRRSKLSCQLFSSKCTDAAIRGGVAPDIAYSLGAGYIQQMEDAKTVTELAELDRQMYRDFITLVRQTRQRCNVSSPIKRCIDYIELYPERHLSLSVLSQEVGYSKNHLNEKFKKEIGITINEYIKFIRIERAKFLLEHTSLSIEEISERLRYASRGYFSGVFKSVVGVSPPVYRASKQQ